jgi:uncharacterized protein (TIGR04255 family)
MSQLPKYDSPPVIETVLSGQFSPLPGFTTAHAGWYWKKCLTDLWTTVREVPVIQDMFERFEEERSWSPESTLRLSTEPESNRLQIIRNDDERMIQVQPSRFVYNWKKSGAGDYPSYEKLLPEFREQFETFCEFVREAGFSNVGLNQWEVTYVNHLVRGDLWHDVSDWSRVIPRLGMFYASPEGQQFDAFNGTWSLMLGDKKGRLHVGVKHVRVGSAKGPEAMAIQLIARGPVDEKKGMTLQDGFDLGHAAIVETFTEMTSSDAHKHWLRRV